MEKYKVRIEIPGIPEIRTNARMHWRTLHAHDQKWQQWVLLSIGQKKPRVPLPQSKITLTRYSGVQPDNDNLAASFKPVIDGLRKAGVIENDTPKHVATSFRWCKAPAKLGKVVVEVEEI